MGKKKSNKEESQQETSSLLKRLRDLIYQQRYCYRLSHNTKMTYSGTTFSGITKSWLTKFRGCRKQHQCPQLVELPTADSCASMTRDHSYRGYRFYGLWNPPPPGLRHIDTILEFASSRSYNVTDYSRLVLTGVSNPAFMVLGLPTYSNEGEGKSGRAITHKSTEIDPYDANNGVIKFSYVFKSGDGKYYAVSLQGALVMMEQVDDQRIVITGVCATRAIPSSTSVKFYTEYLFESKGEIFLVFLIYKESVSKLADEIEVLKLDVDTLKLVKVDKLQGRSLFLELGWCVWVDSEEVGCKGDSVYFTGVSSCKGEWRVYDMKSGSISDGVYLTGGSASNGPWRVHGSISDDSWEWIEII